MLVVTRLLDEVIRIRTEDGKLIRIMVVQIKPGKVRIGIEAPLEFNIVREELVEEVEHE